MFAILDTPEYEKIVNTMDGVNNYLNLFEDNIYVFDINSKLVFKFYCLDDAMYCDNDQFIIIEHIQDKETIIRARKNNLIILVGLICLFNVDDNIKNLQSLHADGEYIKVNIGTLEIKHNDITRIMQLTAAVDTA